MVGDAVRRFFREAGLDPSPVIVAVSGGVDSTALLLAMADLRAAGYRIAAAHVNHHLRGAASEGDEAFLRDLCAKLEIPLHVADGTLPAEAVRLHGIEAAAREIRYEKLRELRAAALGPAALVATAHQRNDQAETIVMRILTGSGIAGLRGIHPIRDDGFVRPLLDVPREEIEDYLAARGVRARHDASNDDPRFLRNRVRALLRESGGVAAVAAIARQARMFWPWVEAAIDEADRSSVEAGPNEARFTSLPDDSWLRQALLLRHIRRLDPASRDVSSDDLARLAGEMESKRRIQVTKRLELLRDGTASVLRQVAETTAPQAFDQTLIPGTPVIAGRLRIGVDRVPLPIRLPYEGGGNRQLFQLPHGSEPAFTLRGRRSGDRFHPLGAPGSKKLKDFLIDRKIRREDRDRIPLLLWNDEIVWVGGVAVSEHFKVTDPPGDPYEVWMEDSGGSDDGAHSDVRR